MVQLVWIFDSVRACQVPKSAEILGICLFRKTERCNVRKESIELYTVMGWREWRSVLFFVCTYDHNHSTRIRIQMFYSTAMPTPGRSAMNQISLFYVLVTNVIYTTFDNYHSQPDRMHHRPAIIFFRARLYTRTLALHLLLCCFLKITTERRLHFSLKTSFALPS